MKKSRFQKAIASLLSFAFAFMVFSFSFAPKAYAVEYNGDVNYGFKVQSPKSASYTKQYTNTASTPILNGNKSGSIWNNNNAGVCTGDFYFSTPTNTEYNSNFKLYASYYFVRQNNYAAAHLTDDFFTVDTWTPSYINTYGQAATIDSGIDKITSFSPSVSGAIGNTGVAIECTWAADTIYPIRTLALQRNLGTGVYIDTYTGSSNMMIAINVPSLRVITTETTAEMEALDNVASEIAAQSDILLAMKGDIVAILQDIYTMTGDIHIAQNLLNGYIAQLLPLIQSIDQTTTNIYSLLSSQLAALETAINTSASTIEAAIEAQTAAMIAYLEEMFNTGNEVPDETYQQQQDAENILDQMESLEKPDVETIVPEIDDYSDGGVSGVMSAIFSSNLIVTMMTLSASLAFGAYVLFGKRS